MRPASARSLVVVKCSAERGHDGSREALHAPASIACRPYHSDQSSAAVLLIAGTLLDNSARSRPFSRTDGAVQCMRPFSPWLTRRRLCVVICPLFLLRAFWSPGEPGSFERWGAIIRLRTVIYAGPARMARLLSRCASWWHLGELQAPMATQASLLDRLLGAPHQAVSWPAPPLDITGRQGPVIYGLEGDLGNLGLAGSGGYYVPFGYDASTSTDAGFYMTLRGRLGVLMNGWMLYATAGDPGADTTVSVLRFPCDIFCGYADSECGELLVLQRLDHRRRPRGGVGSVLVVEGRVALPRSRLDDANDAGRRRHWRQYMDRRHRRQPRARRHQLSI